MNQKKSPCMTRSELQSHLHYDPDTGIFTWRYRPSVPRHVNSRFAGKTAGSTNTQGYTQIRIHNQRYLAHTLAVIYMLDMVPEEVCHNDHNPANIAWDNLQITKPYGRRKNSSRHRDNTSGVVGVCWDKETNRWLAYISNDKERIRLGRYTDFNEAVAIRRAAERKYGYNENHGKDIGETTYQAQIS